MADRPKLHACLCDSKESTTANISLSIKLALLSNYLELEGCIRQAAETQHMRAVAEELEHNVQQLRAALKAAQDALDRLMLATQPPDQG